MTIVDEVEGALREIMREVGEDFLRAMMEHDPKYDGMPPGQWSVAKKFNSKSKGEAAG
jgi:hypothetical protein